MFKYSKDLIPLPIVELLAGNYEFHNYYIIQVHHFILQLAETKRSTKHLHFMAIEFGTTYQQYFRRRFVCQFETFFKIIDSK